MMENEYLHLLKAYPRLTPKLRKSILNSADTKLLKSICEICLNIIKGNVHLNDSHKKKLSQYKKVIRKLGDKNPFLLIKRKN